MPEECIDCRDLGQKRGPPRRRLLGGQEIYLCEHHWQKRLKLDFKWRKR